MIAVLGLVVIGTFEAKARGAGVSAQQQPAGCTTCHGTGTIKALVGEVPPGQTMLDPQNPPVSTDVNYCLQCHTLAATAPAFSWTVHQSHFATEIAAAGKKATCDLCHTLDASGNFTLTGASNSPSFKTTAAVVAKMPTYYTSWATSKHLDHTHAQRSVTCALCHGRRFPEKRAEMEQCLTCHGSYQHVAELTKNVYPNPHESHLGEIRCTLCHKAHANSELYCDLCHAFGLKVP